MSVTALLGSQLPFGVEGLIVGLGNPGSTYEDTPHNIGFQVLDALAHRWKVSFKPLKKANASIATVLYEGKRYLLVKPLTYMNRSGEAIAPLMQCYDIPTEQLLVVVDEINLDFGTVRIRPKGSGGGQNGMKHIIQALGHAQQFPRLRIGIGPQPEGVPLEHYVLAPYKTDQKQMLEAVCLNACACIETALRDGIAIAQNQFNR